MHPYVLTSCRIMVLCASMGGSGAAGSVTRVRSRSAPREWSPETQEPNMCSLGQEQIRIDTGHAILLRGKYVTCRHPVCAGSLRQSAV